MTRLTTLFMTSMLWPSLALAQPAAPPQTVNRAESVEVKAEPAKAEPSKAEPSKAETLKAKRAEAKAKLEATKARVAKTKAAEAQAAEAKAKREAAEFDAQWQADARVQLHLRGGVMFFEDKSLDAISADPYRDDTRVGVDYRLGEHLWVGASLGGGFRDGKTHKHDSELQVFGYRGHAIYREHIKPWLSYSARAGVGYHKLNFTLDGPWGPELRDKHWVPAVHGAVGVEAFPIRGRSIGVGVSFELTYDRYLPATFSDGGVDFGELDPSGPGLLLGLVLQF